MRLASVPRLAAVVLLALVLAACGGGDKLVAPTTTEATTTTTTADDGPGGLFGDDEDDDIETPGGGLFGGGSSGGSTSAPTTTSGSGNSQDPDDVMMQAFGTTEVDSTLASKLIVACADGDMAACDTLYLDSPRLSWAEDFAAKCGTDVEATAYCIVEHQDSPATFSYVPAAGGGYEGDAGDLNGLVDDCILGSMNSCDLVLELAERGSELWLFGATCAYRSTEDLFCADQWGLGRASMSWWRAQFGY